jgi:formamidopyrimidine-DNA glycosylase
LPELPEVETIVRSIAPLIRGRTILRAEVRSLRVTRQPFVETAQALTGATVQDVGRRGKQMFVQLDRGTLYIHLGMTGKLLWNGDDDKFTRALLEFESGTLLFHDVRQFGRFEFFREIPASLSNKGPDALTVDFETFYSRLRRHRGAIKAVLLNQVFVAGVGNIYADEILFAAHVHPRTQAARISRRRAQLLHGHTLEILQAAIQSGGSSISDYVDAAGKKGDFQLLHRVYGRTGEPCTECGTPVRRIVIAQRGTHYCPHCQRV